jgi:hypothetical protein
MNSKHEKFGGRKCLASVRDMERGADITLITAPLAGWR